MRSKWIKILAAAICVVMALPAAGSAAPLEPDRKCSLTVEAIKPTEENKNIAADLEEALEKKNDAIVYDLYKVGAMVDDGGYYTYEFTSDFQALKDNTALKEKYGSVVDDKGYLLVPRDGSAISGNLWEDLAQEAGKRALGVSLEDIRIGGPDTGAEGGLTVIGEVVGTNKPGEGAFAPQKEGVSLGEKQENLDAGLYLLIARGSGVETYITKEAVKDSKPDDGQGGADSSAARKPEEKLVTVAYTDQHVYTFAPQLISLPTKAPDANGQVSTANNGDWIYNPTVFLKPEQHPRYGYLEIVKDLLKHESFAGQSEEAVFVFQVEATLDGVSVYSDVKTMIFTEAGEKRVLIDKIPVGATVTVTEVYSGASYTLEKIEQGYHAVKDYPDSSIVYTTAGNVDTREVEGIVIEANRVPSVKFTNDYDHRQTGGHGVINHYEYGVNGWADDVQQQWTNPAQSNPPQGNENP